MVRGQLGPEFAVHWRLALALQCASLVTTFWTAGLWRQPGPLLVTSMIHLARKLAPWTVRVLALPATASGGVHWVYRAPARALLPGGAGAAGQCRVPVVHPRSAVQVHRDAHRAHQGEGGERRAGEGSARDELYDVPDGDVDGPPSRAGAPVPYVDHLAGARARGECEFSQAALEHPWEAQIP